MTHVPVWEGGDVENVKLTLEGKQRMTRYLLSKRAASLIDCVWVGTQVDMFGRCMCPDEPTDEIAHDALDGLAAYISELESLKGDSNDD